MVEEHELPIGSEVMPLDFKVDIKVNCADCGGELLFWGMPMGVHPTRPTISADQKEVRLNAGIELKAR